MLNTFYKERKKLRECLAKLQSNQYDFNELAIKIFHFQYKYNLVYHSYVNNLKIDHQTVTRVSQIPYLPISAFKHHKVQCGDLKPEITFTSSGTSSLTRSQHLVNNLDFYLNNTVDCFSSTFTKSVSEYCFIALLPSYMDRPGSSLIEMMNYYIGLSTHNESGFYHGKEAKMLAILRKLSDQHIPTIVLGVSYALLDLVEKNTYSFPNIIFMETGGMKGRREEMTKESLHSLLCKRLGVKSIYSEYGMTELMSQCYSKGNGIFYHSHPMKVEIREINDPTCVRPYNKSGQIHIIDLANIDSCSFIQTEDIGIQRSKNSFEILGRLDYSDLRGCNLLLEEL